MLEVVEFALMVGIDMLFVAILVLVMLPLGMYRAAAFAVMKRNFVGYFSNPTGYVFLCLFVLLTAFAAFWPHEFFTANLANFDQLNKFLPYIMLVFIPAITMSIWAEERRQGTDELLLTFPAHDFDIVMGKYFAAVLVFTVSLLFSQLSNYAVLIAMTGGELDTGLLFSTYLGYWFIGIAMLAIGMVASFLTNNLTIGFIFGAVFNAPLAFFSNSDVIISSRKVVSVLYEWSLLQRFEPFGRGLIALPSIIYFIGIVMLGVYLSLVLIGRRHWLGGKDGSNLLGHYLVRIVLLFVIAISSVLVAQHSPLNRLRLDVSREQVSTLAADTKTQLGQLTDNTSNNLTITIDCYISDNIPTNYVPTKYELINRLREFDALGGAKIKVNLNEGISPVGKEAILAEKRFGIRPVPVSVTARGSQRTENIILGAAFTSGLNRMVIPFFDYGMSVEYELIRSLKTLDQSDRKTVGIVMTDISPFGSQLRVGNQVINIPQMFFIEEIKKQYNIEIVEATAPIPVWLDEESGSTLDQKRRYDVLLVFQPSKMSDQEMKNLIAAIETGQPTAIFEDPDPKSFVFSPSQNARPQPYVGGTSFPRFFSRQGSLQADVANIDDLYSTLGISTQGTMIRVPVSQNSQETVEKFFPASVVTEVENPYKRAKEFESDNYVLVRETAADAEPRFAPQDNITEGLTEVCFVKPGSIVPAPNATTQVEPLVQSADLSWVWQVQQQVDKSPNNAAAKMIGARITGKSKNSSANLDVVYVADVDVVANQFFLLRNRPEQFGHRLQLENMHFAMNIIDSLAEEENYFQIRNRQIRHATLRKIEEKSREAWSQYDDAVSELDVEAARVQQQEIDEARLATQEISSRIMLMEKKQEQGEPIDLTLLKRQKDLLEQIQRDQSAKIQQKMQVIDDDGREKKRRIYLDAELEIQKKQSTYKLGAVTYPAIPPLLVGLIVFVRRRLKERAGISKARRLK